ncbi:MAG: AarF/UbiB family protein [Dysgonomonas sp.]|uniref:ABC1 kinase family protein n=1 Tax=Dysgonomonas sp. TaxID=1891233 RepID=UPI0039E3E37B
MDSIRKIKRTAQLVSILTKYGFDTLVTETGIKNLIPESYINKNEKRKEIFSLSIYERIRLALEELGPTYIKLGQLLSNRDDLFPIEMIEELQKLQDNVQTKEIDLRNTIKKEFNKDIDDLFSEIDTNPIAAASLSQVYTGILLENNQKVIIKVKRESIEEMIEADLLIMKDFSRLLETYYDIARQTGINHIIRAFEKSILSELSFTQELNNIERFRKNFRKNPSIYTPATYKHLSNNNILCMEFIDGIKVSDKQQLTEQGLDTKNVAMHIVDLYLKQVIEYGYFHADPHSGNIFVLPSSQIVFIDYGSVGRIIPQDQELLANFVMHILRKDTRRLIRIIKKIALEYKIKNDAQFERDLYDFLDIIDTDSIKDLNLQSIIKRFSRILYDNRIILPDYIYLLARSIVILEGIGRELGLEASIIDHVKPYGHDMIKQRLNPKYIKNLLMDKLYSWNDRLEELPEDFHSLIQKINHDDLKITHNINGLSDIKNTINRLVLAILISSIAVGSSILILASMPPLLRGVSILGLLGVIISGALAIVVILTILRNKKEK